MGTFFECGVNYSSATSWNTVKGWKQHSLACAKNTLFPRIMSKQRWEDLYYIGRHKGDTKPPLIGVSAKGAVFCFCLINPHSKTQNKNPKNTIRKDLWFVIMVSRLLVYLIDRLDTQLWHVTVPHCLKTSLYLSFVSFLSHKIALTLKNWGLRFWFGFHLRSDSTFLPSLKGSGPSTDFHSPWAHLHWLKNWHIQPTAASAIKSLTDGNICPPLVAP